MIYIEKVQVLWIKAGTVANPDDRVYGGLIVDYRQNDREAIKWHISCASAVNMYQ